MWEDVPEKVVEPVMTDALSLGASKSGIEAPSVATVPPRSGGEGNLEI